MTKTQNSSSGSTNSDKDSPSLPETPKANGENNPTAPITVPDLTKAIFEGYGASGTEQTKNIALQLISRYLQQSASQFKAFEKYNLVILYDSSRMVKGDADDIYNAVTTFKEKKPLLMILYSNGGVIGSAYLIGKLCREYSNGTFLITVPRSAKSSATLLCCAADEIHMGSLSELGPIDPQIDKLPALGLKNSIEHIAQLVKKTPEAADMFAKYLNYSLKPIDLGYYERVAESALQYAERLLSTHSANLPREASVIANELVYTYKDHGFVIDKSEAERIFGTKIIQQNSEEYNLGNTLYRDISFLDRIFEFLSYNFYFIGLISSEPKIRKKS